MVHTKKLTQLALLTAISLSIFLVELQIPNPFPLPAMKLGLANIITIYAIYRYSAGEASLILFTRIILGGIFSGNLMAIGYSLSGGILCLIGSMFISRILPIKYIWLTSICGAILHNIGQLIVATILTKTLGIIAYLPLLIISGAIAGLCTGICAKILLNRLERYNLVYSMRRTYHG